jgi:hypothetical protein
MGLTRTLEPHVRQAAATFPVIVVTGPRQCGKTTMLQGLFGQSHGYVTLDHPDLVARAHADPISFFRDHPTPLVLDEVQHAPGLLPYIKAAVDADRRPGRFVLTGSQSFPLMRGIAESLAGRAAVLRLDPFHSGVEIDLVVEWDGRLHAIEIKSTATPTPTHAAGLRQWLDWAGPRARGAVACLVERPTALTPGIRAVPWHLAVHAANGADPASS